MTFASAFGVAGRLWTGHGFRYGVATGAASFGCAGAVQFVQHQQSRACCEQSSQGAEVSLRVSYTSTMRGDAATASSVVKGIVEESTQRNLKMGISGHYCYDAKLQRVWHELEGSRDQVGAVWEGIAQDPRHVIDEDAVEVEMVKTRKYPQGWGLRYSRFDKIDGEAHDEDPDIDTCNIMQLSYKSIMEDPNLAEREVMEVIVPHASAANAKTGVTGWMLYNDRTAMMYQVLEGPPNVVEGLWQKLRQDPRHTVFERSVVKKKIAARDFPDWPMCSNEIAPCNWTAQSY